MKSTATRVRKGIKLLDAKGPKDWRKKVKLDELDMWNCSVLNYVYADYAEYPCTSETLLTVAMQSLGLTNHADLVKHGFCLPKVGYDQDNRTEPDLATQDELRILTDEWKRQINLNFWSLRNLIDTFFKLEEIKSGDHCPPYMFRWTLFKSVRLGCSLYVHHFVGDDGARDLHDHPRKFTTLGLWGRYVEETPHVDAHGGKSTVLVDRKTYTAPWLRSFPAEHRHRLTLFPGETCWTLAFVWPLKREWGFWVRGKFIPWRQYVYSDGSQDRDC